MVAESNTRKHCIYFLCYLRPPPTGSAGYRTQEEFVSKSTVPIA